MKKEIKLHLETDILKHLELKAREAGIEGRGWLPRYLRFIAPKDLAYLDDNFRKVARAFKKFEGGI
jgi:hypothetical protein